MDLRQVEYVLAVVDHGTFTRAARAVHVAQPSLSQSIKRLERELGAPLFHRVGRSVVLTDAGEAFVGPARRLMREARNVAAAVGDHAALAAGTLDIVAIPTLVADPLVPAIGRARRAHPGLVIRIHDPVHPASLLAMVGDGRAEIGITEAGATPHGLVRRRLGVQELQAVLPPGGWPPGHPVPLSTLAEHPLILGPAGTSTRQIIDAALAEVGLAATVVVETSQREAIAPLVRAGAGATVLPGPLAQEAAALGSVSVGVDPPVTRPVDVVHRDSGLSPAAAAFLDVLPQSDDDGAA